MISVVIQCVNLNKMNALEKLENNKQPVHWFGLTELNKTMGIMCSRNISEKQIADEIL